MEEELRILTVDDEPTIREFVGYALEKEGFAVQTAGTGQEALDLISDTDFNLLILDIMLPDIDGFEICRRVRETSNVPVLFLSARDDEKDKVAGLEIGGDDYLAKPFGVRELIARVRALLRRSSLTPMDAFKEETLTGAGLVLNETTHKVFREGTELDLTPREFELLAHLMRNCGSVVSREDLLHETWGWEYLTGTKTVDTHIKRLRDKMKLAGMDPSVIETVRSYGYRLKK